MYFGFSDEQAQFRAAVRRFMRERSPVSEVRRQMMSSDGYDRVFWRQMCDEVGLAGIQVPEQYGGQGFGFVEIGIALEEMGRALCCAPYFGSAVLATQAILNGATEAQKAELLPAIAAGTRIATLAYVEASGDWDPAGIRLTATPAGEGYLLDGRKCYVIDGAIADVLIVAGRAPGTAGDEGIALFAVDAAGTGITRRPLETIDLTRRQAEIVFERAPARRLGTHGYGARTLRRTLDESAIALACEMTGGAQALLESAVEYAKLRMQFGRPIGSFQAIKHKCADLLLEVELALSGARYAAAAAAIDDPETPALASLAKACASDAYMRAAVDCIQIHGGIGFTWDHDTHLWFRRAKSSEVMLGTTAAHRERYVALTAAAA